MLQRPRTLALCAVLVVLLSMKTVGAINALVSQDLPLLAQIASTEAASYLELGAILAEVGALVATAKEYTTVAKTAWGALEELRHMSAKDLRDVALLGVRGAFPEAEGIYNDIRDIRDLDYRDYRAVATLRGIVWEEVYGPAIDYMHTGHDTLEALSTMQEHTVRQRAKAEARRAQATAWAEDCERTAGQGEGACQAAAHRAAVQQALSLSDVQETNLHILDAQQRQLKQQQREEADRIYAFERWLFDLERYLGASSGAGEDCPAGRCLYERYGNAMRERVQLQRARHPPRTQRAARTEGGW